MPVVVTDLVQDATFHSDKNGFAAVRVFAVYGLDQASDTLYQAGIAPGVPRYGNPHPAIPALFCLDVDIKPWAQDGRTAAKVTCTYGWQNFGGGSTQVTIASSTSVVNANRDINPDGGGFFVVSYSMPPNAGKYQYDSAFFNIYTQHVTVTFQRNEQGSPLSKAGSYVGRVNPDGGWQGLGSNSNWLCRSIGGTALGGGIYQVTYTFEYAPEGWTQVALFHQQQDQRIPGDVKLRAQGLSLFNIGGVSNGQNIVGDGVMYYTPLRSAQPFSALSLPQA